MAVIGDWNEERWMSIALHSPLFIGGGRGGWLLAVFGQPFYPANPMPCTSGQRITPTTANFTNPTLCIPCLTHYSYDRPSSSILCFVCNARHGGYSKRRSNIRCGSYSLPRVNMRIPRLDTTAPRMRAHPWFVHGLWLSIQWQNLLGDGQRRT